VQVHQAARFALCFLAIKKHNLKNRQSRVHTYNPSTWEAKQGRLRVQSLPELHSQTLSQKIKRGKNTSISRTFRHSGKREMMILKKKSNQENSQLLQHTDSAPIPSPWLRQILL
jgi:hypothetical protein